MAVVLREAGDDEVATACRLIQEAYTPQDLGGTICESPLFHRHLQVRRQSGDLFLVASGTGRNEQALYALAQVVRGAESLHLNHLVVRSSARGQGLGRRLLAEVIRQAKDSGKTVTLDVDSRNHGAQHLYLGSGFRVESSTQIQMRPYISGSMPPGLVDGSAEYEQFGFCYTYREFSRYNLKIGIIGDKTVRIVDQDIPDQFDWDEFMDWARWANIYIYGDFAPIARAPGWQKWENYRMQL